MRIAGPYVGLAACALCGGCRLHFDRLGDGDAATTDGDARRDGNGTSDGAPVDQVLGVVMDIEAESGLVIAPFEFRSTGPETYVYDNNSIGAAGTGSLGFTVIIPAPGTYFIWGRVLTQDATTDSFSVTFGGLGPFVYDSSECDYSGFWHWTRLRIDGTCAPLSPPRGFALTAAAVSLSFTSHEGGSRFDKLVVTDDPSYVPP